MIFTPLNLHIFACVNARTPLCKTSLIKKKFHQGQRACTIWIYEGSGEHARRKTICSSPYARVTVSFS